MVQSEEKQSLEDTFKNVRKILPKKSQMIFKKNLEKLKQEFRVRPFNLNAKGLTMGKVRS